MNLSTNEIMFDCQVDILNNCLATDTILKVNSFINKYYHFNGDEGKAQENYSSDNWETVYLWCKKFHPDKTKQLPLFGHHSKNPFDFFFFAYMKGHKYLYPLVVLDVLMAGVKPYKLNQKTKEWNRDTSGKIKAYFKMRVLKMAWTKWLVDQYIYRSDYYQSWLNIFQIYHKKDEYNVVRAFIKS